MKLWQIEEQERCLLFNKLGAPTHPVRRLRSRTIRDTLFLYCTVVRLLNLLVFLGEKAGRLLYQVETIKLQRQLTGYTTPERKICRVNTHQLTTSRRLLIKIVSPS